MASNCPHCKDRNLHPSRIEADLPALSCDGCGGSLLSLVAYRHWRENQPEHAPNDGDAAHASAIANPVPTAFFMPRPSLLPPLLPALHGTRPGIVATGEPIDGCRMEPICIDLNFVCQMPVDMSW